MLPIALQKDTTTYQQCMRMPIINFVILTKLVEKNGISYLAFISEAEHLLVCLLANYIL